MKFNDIYANVLGEIHFREINNSLTKLDLNSKMFYHTYRYLISESYNIFPVPKNLIEDMTEFALTNSGKEKHYNFNDILTKYTINWKYYKQFKENMKLMLKNNMCGSIVLCPFSTKNELDHFLSKYPNASIKNSISSATNAVIYDYNSNFDLCLLLYVKNASKQKINKRIQHELIHWMQVTLNSHTKKNYGIFEDRKFDISDNDLKWLYDVLEDIDLCDVVKYLQNGIEFEPWVANSVEEFENLNYSFDMFKRNN